MTTQEIIEEMERLLGLLKETTGIPEDVLNAAPEPVPFDRAHCPHVALLHLYHTHCPTLPQVKALTDQRRKFARQRWREVLEDRTPDEALEWFEEFFKRVHRAPWLTGQVPNRSHRPFLADYEWLMRPSNFIKVHEGRYDG